MLFTFITIPSILLG